MERRYVVSASAGSQGNRHYAVLDRLTRDRQGMRRVSFHRSAAEAIAEARRLNSAER